MRLDILACVPSRTDWFRRNRREDKTEVYASATTIGCANPGFRFGRRRDLKAALRRKLTAAQTDRTTATQQRKGSTSRLRLRRLLVRANDSTDIGVGPRLWNSARCQGSRVSSVQHLNSPSCCCPFRNSS